jgi:hypothetical protein
MKPAPRDRLTTRLTERLTPALTDQGVRLTGGPFATGSALERGADASALAWISAAVSAGRRPVVNPTSPNEEPP